MKKLLLVLTLAALFSGPVAYAQNLNADVNVTVKSATTGSTVSNERRNENGTASSSNNAQVKGSVKSNNGNASTSTNGSASLTAESHRSAIATFVQTLRATAERDGGIGAKVRVVAQSQSDAASTTIDAMTKIENRNKAASFFFGTDWKSAGAIRSAIAQNDADIRNLEKLVSVTSNASVRAELEAEIETLENARKDLEDFVTSHEEKFSLLGWFTKLFVGAGA